MGIKLKPKELMGIYTLCVSNMLYLVLTNYPACGLYRAQKQSLEKTHREDKCEVSLGRGEGYIPVSSPQTSTYL